MTAKKELTWEAAMSVQIIHPYVTQVEGVARGKPVIRGTRTPVRSIVAW